MRIRITESRAGELSDKASDVVRVVEQLTGTSLLKSAPTHDQHVEAADRFEHPALKSSVARSRDQVVRIKKLMRYKLESVLDEPLRKPRQ